MATRLKEERLVLIKLGLFATVPVLLIVAVAGMLRMRKGASAMWAALALGLLAIIMVWAIVERSEPLLMRFVAPIALFAPPLLFGGLVLASMKPGTLLASALVALVAAGSNVVLAPWFFTLGAALGAWEGL